MPRLKLKRNMYDKPNRRGFPQMFLDDLGYIKKKWMWVIVSSTAIIPIIGVFLWTIAFPKP